MERKLKHLGASIISFFHYDHPCGKEINFKINIEIDEDACRGENRLERTSRIDNLVRTMFRVDNKEMTFGEALNLLKSRWMLQHLDQSLSGVRNQRKSKEEHNKYFESLIKQLMKLSQYYHSDKGKVKDDEMQKLINQSIKVLRNIHSYIINNDTYILNKGCYLLYGMYNHIPLSTLNSDEDMLQVVKVSVADGMSALYELMLLADLEEGYLMNARNTYLKTAKESVRSLGNMLSCIKDKIKPLKNDINDTWKKFIGNYNKYVEEYCRHWINHLKCLNERCKTSVLLEIIKPSVEKLLEESNKQYKMLEERSYGRNPNEKFVLPILQYYILVTAYYKFAIKLCNDRNKFNYLSNQPVTIRESEDNKLNKLSDRELLLAAWEKVNKDVINNDELEETMSMLLGLMELFDNKIEIEKTAFQRHDEEFEQLKKERTEWEEEAKQVKDKAQQEYQRGNLIEEVTGTFGCEVFRSNMDETLKMIMFEKQKWIVREVVEYVMIHNISPKEVLNKIMEGIERKGIVIDETVENSVKEFLATNEIYETVE